MANKKLFQDLVLGTPSSTDRFAFGKSGSAYKNITYGDLKNLILASVPPPYEPPFLTKIVNIGAFDMYPGDKEKELYLGVARSKIRNVSVNILSNSGGVYSMASPAGNDELRSWWRVMQESSYASNARIKLYSENNSFFDQSAFNGNGPGSNRGYVLVTYVE